MPPNFSYEEKQLINVIPRVALVFSLSSAIYMAWFILSTKYCRSRIYHRIMLGCAIDIIIYTGLNFWGSAAAPVGSSSLGARGNQTTCSIQGFFLYFTVFVVPYYYASLSFISYRCLCVKFDFSKILWIEKYLHFGVISIPLACATVLLSVDAYNPVVSNCGFASLPIGCGDNFFTGKEGITCTRGPQNIQQFQVFFGILPMLLLIFFPAIVMIIIFLKARKLGPSQRKIAKSVANQSLIYVLVVFATYCFRILDFFVMVFSKGKVYFVLRLLAKTNESLNGLWILVSYLWFRSNPGKGIDQARGNSSCNDEEADISPNNSIPAAIENPEVENEHCVPKTFFNKPDFSIFDGGEVLTDSPWSRYLSEGVDPEYQEGSLHMQ